MTTLLLSSGIAFADVSKEVGDVRHNVQEEMINNPRGNDLNNLDENRRLNTDRSVIDNQDALENERMFDQQDAENLREHNINKEMKQDLEVDGSDGTETIDNEELLD